jgi:hypothetical protein
MFVCLCLFVGLFVCLFIHMSYYVARVFASARMCVIILLALGTLMPPIDIDIITGKLNYRDMHMPRAVGVRRRGQAGSGLECN